MLSNELVLNSPERDLRVLDIIKDELQRCDKFFMSVAFITGSGITPLLQILKDVNSEGKILTTDYNYFTQPNAIRSLMSLDNIEVRIFKSEDVGFHTKGYLFNQNGKFNILVGSSNLTANALMKNKEWNVYSTYDEEDKFTMDLLDSFNQYWSQSVNAEDYIDEYERLYNKNKPKFILQRDNQTEEFTPNSMQREFIEKFVESVDNGDKRGLLISATGTGKTFASAFALKEVNPKRLLFLVHREQIAKQSMETFKKVFDDDSFGLLSGNHKDYNSKYLFSTIQKMSKEYVYTRFKPDEFDYIVIDEVHRAGANSYQKIMDYFRPKFYLGMSASPDCSDDFDIYKLFNHNIIYEIRLKKALKENMLCDFHYFGVYDPIDANDTSDRHVDNIIENIEYYGFNGSRVKGLVFCNSVENSIKLSEQFNKRGYNTVALSGSNTQEEREYAIERLTTNDNEADYLDYIFTVDIFNEGVDIKELNQIIMLRPTESSIIFIQQLGRGLRKTNEKEYVVILDFISNYDNNYLIPIALSDDRTYNKDRIRHFVSHTSIIGNSTINIDEIAKEKIFQAITDASLERISFIREKYRNLKYKLNKIPTLMDFYEYDELDPMFILSYIKGKYSSYPELLPRLDKDAKPDLNNDELLYLKFITTKIADGKRPHELYILKKLIQDETVNIQIINDELNSKYQLNDNMISTKHAINVLNKTFYKDKDRKEYEKVEYFTEDEYNLTITKKFKKLLQNIEFRDNIYDLINLGLHRYEDIYQHQTPMEAFKYYEKYSRDDVVRLLNLESNDSSTIYGYRTKEDLNNNLHTPIFVTYNKMETISKSTQYEDEFINEEEFSWMTRSNLKIQSSEVQRIINYRENGNKLYLFIKKSDDEGREFYYMGKVEPIEYKQTTILNDKNQEKPIVNIRYKLEKRVQRGMYEYITK